MVNVWIINHHASYYNGRHFYMGRYLSEKGFHVRVFRASTRHVTGEQISDFDGLFYEKNINKISYVFIKAREYGKSSKKRLLNILDFTKNILKVYRHDAFEKPDIVIASSVHPLAWYAGKKIAKRFNIPLIIETRDLWPETLVSMGSLKRNSLFAKMLYAYEKHFYTIADALVFTIEGRKDYLRSIGVNKDAHYVNNGVDLENFEYNKTNFPYSDRQYIEDTRFKVVYTGSMGKANKISEILEAIKVINQMGIMDISFYFFGTGKEIEELKRYVEKTNLTQVYFMGLVDSKFIPSILSQSDLNMISGHSIPLYQYGLSLNKLFDYLASEKPTLSNLVCGYDIIEKYGAGVTVENTTPDALAEKILFFKEMNSSDYEKYCKNAGKAARDFDYRNLATKYAEIINDTLKIKDPDKGEFHDC